MTARRIYRATAEYWHSADGYSGTVTAYAHDPVEAANAAMRAAPDTALAVLRGPVTSDTHGACCECPRGHRLHDAGLLAALDGQLYCVEHGITNEIGLEWDAYPLLRWTCRECGVLCDAREAEDCGGLCVACAADARQRDREDYEAAHAVGAM